MDDCQPHHYRGDVQWEFDPDGQCRDRQYECDGGRNWQWAVSPDGPDDYEPGHCHLGCERRWRGEALHLPRRQHHDSRGDLYRYRDHDLHDCDHAQGEQDALGGDWVGPDHDAGVGHARHDPAGYRQRLCLHLECDDQCRRHRGQWEAVGHDDDSVGWDDHGAADLAELRGGDEHGHRRRRDEHLVGHGDDYVGLLG